MTDFEWIDTTSSYAYVGAVYDTPSGNTLHVRSIRDRKIFYTIVEVGTLDRIPVEGVEQWFNRNVKNGIFIEKI
jgi:hypothetical protein